MTDTDQKKARWVVSRLLCFLRGIQSGNVWLLALYFMTCLPAKGQAHSFSHCCYEHTHEIAALMNTDPASHCYVVKVAGE